MTDTDQSNTTTPEEPIAKTVERADFTYGVIAARINETRFAKGGRRYGVVLRRDVGDLCLEGEFSMSLDQDELMNLIAAAAEAYHAIDALRFQRKCSGSADVPFAELPADAGWEPDHDEVFPSQIEP